MTTWPFRASFGCLPLSRGPFEGSSTPQAMSFKDLRGRRKDFAVDPEKMIGDYQGYIKSRGFSVITWNFSLQLQPAREFLLSLGGLEFIFKGKNRVAWA